MPVKHKPLRPPGLVAKDIDSCYTKRKSNKSDIATDLLRLRPIQCRSFGFSSESPLSPDLFGARGCIVVFLAASSPSFAEQLIANRS